MTPDRIDYLAELAEESGSTPIEGRLAAAFVRQRGQYYLDLKFQKRVGPGQTLPPGSDPKIARMAYQATRRRVDVVGYTPAGVILIEVKDEITWPALVQLIDYRDLWLIAPGTPPPVGLMVVGRSIDAGITERAAGLGIQVVLLPDLASA